MKRRTFATAMLAAASASLASFPASAVLAQSSSSAAADPVLPVVPDMIIGNMESKVVLTEYASYTCPHCANFHASVFKDLRKDYIDTGKIKFVYREVFFDREGL